MSLKTTLEVENKKSIFNKLWECVDKYSLYIMLVPGLIILILNCYIPMTGMVVAFKKVNYIKGIFGSPWNGLENFEFLFKGGKAWTITRNTVLYNLGFITICNTVGVAVAIMLNDISNKRLKKLYQSTIFLPYFFSWVIMGSLTYLILSPSVGYLNTKIFAYLGIEKINFYTMSQMKTWPWIIMIVNSWKWTGYDSVIFLAAITGFSKEYYEAAVIDGANKWKQMRYITIPLLKPTIITLTLLKVGRMFFTDMGPFWNLPGVARGMLFDAVSVIDTYVYTALTSASGNLSMAAAASFFQSVAGFACVLITNIIVKRKWPEQSLF